MSMGNPVVYGPAYSTYVRSVRLALEEKGVDYTLEEVDFLHGMPEEHLQRHPFGKVPAFEHDGFWLYEAGAVARYVDEAFEGPDLQPADVRHRARMNQIISIVDSYVYGPVVGVIVIQRLVVPMMDGSPDEAAIEGAKPAARLALGVLEGLLGAQLFMCGESLSLADLHLDPIIAYLAMTPEGEALLAETPKLRRWFESMSGRQTVIHTAPQLG
jgi:glutathione S-transferase